MPDRWARNLRRIIRLQEPATGNTRPIRKYMKSKESSSSSWLFQYLRLILLGVIFVLLGIAVSATLIHHGKSPDLASLGKISSLESLGWKTAEFMAQVILIAIGGGIFMQACNRMQSRKAANNQFRKDALDRLIKAYSDTKRARRSIRAKSKFVPSVGNRSIPCKTYDEHMEVISDTQLSLEVLRRELKVFKGVLNEPSSLIDSVTKMEDYLSKLVSEWERAMKECGNDDSVSLDQLPSLRLFTAHGGEGDFRECFANPFNASLGSLEAERVRLG